MILTVEAEFYLQQPKVFVTILGQATAQRHKQNITHYTQFLV